MDSHDERPRAGVLAAEPPRRHDGRADGYEAAAGPGRGILIVLGQPQGGAARGPGDAACEARASAAAPGLSRRDRGAGSAAPSDAAAARPFQAGHAAPGQTPKLRGQGGPGWQGWQGRKGRQGRQRRQRHGKEGLRQGQRQVQCRCRRPRRAGNDVGRLSAVGSVSVALASGPVQRRSFTATAVGPACQAPLQKGCSAAQSPLPAALTPALGQPRAGQAREQQFIMHAFCAA